MGEVCSILAREFEEPEEVLVRFKIYLPSWAKLEFESVERMKQEMTRKYAPLLDVIRRYQVRIYDERQYVEIDYRRRWLLDNISIRADAEDEEWCARASGAAWRVLESRGERLGGNDFLAFLQVNLWLVFQAFSGMSLLYLWGSGRTDAWLLRVGVAAFALAALTFAPGLASRMFPSDTTEERGGPLRRIFGVMTVLFSIIAVITAVAGLFGV